MSFIPRLLVLVPLALGSLCGNSGAQETGASPDLPSRVRSVFLAKCSECHGRSLSRPRAALYLHELGRVAANREWVVPYDPEKSYLWSLVRNDDMPAKGAKAGPLNAQEKETIRAWIAAGAPVPPSQGDSAQLESATTTTPARVAPSSELQASFGAARLFGWLGRFHVLVVHFPIALLAAAALGEILAARRRNPVPEPAVRFCILLGAGGAVAAVALGWLHADLGEHVSVTNSVLGLHRWLGTAAGAWAIALVLVSERDSRRRRRSLLLQALLGSGALLVLIAAHFGGLLVHGSNFFDW
jgi:uncharacterized membrane protein